MTKKLVVIKATEVAFGDRCGIACRAVEPHRNYPDPGYAENAGWYDDRGYRGEARYGGGDPGEYGDYPEYGAAERDPRRPEPEPTRAQSVGPRSGLPIPEDPAQPRRPPAAAAPGSPGAAGEMYRSRRPALAILFGAVAAILEIPALILLRDATFGTDPVVASGVVAAACLVAALPLAAVGLYAVVTGAVRAAGPNSAQAWLRPPVTYLSLALVLLVAAGLAA